MRDAPDAAIRRNAAMALSLLEDPKAQSMLKRVASEDPDDSVRLQAVEAWPCSRRRRGRQLRTGRFRGHGLPPAVRHPGWAGPTTQKPRRAAEPAVQPPYLEAKLAAARAQAGCGGATVRACPAVVGVEPARPQLPTIRWRTRFMRVRSMAAMALGDIRENAPCPR